MKLAGVFRRRVETLEAVRHLVVTERTTYHAKVPELGRRADLNVGPSKTANDTGIEVHEEEWGTVTAQVVYKMRCECGRSWFELDLLKFVECPACHKLGLISHPGQT